MVLSGDTENMGTKIVAKIAHKLLVVEKNSKKGGILATQ